MFNLVNTMVLDSEVTLPASVPQQFKVLIVFFSGISNHDEYSLVRDLPEEEKEKTLTLKRADKDKTRDYKKMDEMRKKLHTDDDRSCFSSLF